MSHITTVSNSHFPLVAQCQKELTNSVQIFKNHETVRTIFDDVLHHFESNISQLRLRLETFYNFVELDKNVESKAEGFARRVTTVQKSLLKTKQEICELKPGAFVDYTLDWYYLDECLIQIKKDVGR